MKEKNKTVANRWTKSQLLQAERYAHQKDAVAALLKDGETYTVQEVDKIIGKYMKGGAK